MLDSRICNAFMLLEEKQSFSYSVMQKYFSKIIQENIKKTNWAFSQLIKNEWIEYFECIGADTTNIETNIHNPINDSLGIRLHHDGDKALGAHKKEKLGCTNQFRPRNVMDSLAVYGILKYTQDNLLRQMLLLDLFSREFQSLQVEHFEAYRAIFDAYVKELYLREPFLELYAQTKEKIKQKQ